MILLARHKEVIALDIIEEKVDMINKVELPIADYKGFVYQRLLIREKLIEIRRKYFY